MQGRHMHPELKNRTHLLIKLWRFYRDMKLIEHANYLHFSAEGFARSLKIIHYCSSWLDTHFSECKS